MWTISIICMSLACTVVELKDNNFNSKQACDKSALQIIKLLNVLDNEGYSVKCEKIK